MAVTLTDVRASLTPDEPDYTAAARLGPEALPFLEQLVRGEDPMLAAKAAYLASLIPGDARPAVLSTAAASANPVLRVAAAGGLRNLDAEQAEGLAARLLADSDVGVRRLALRSVAQFRPHLQQLPAIAAQLRQIATQDPEQALRQAAANELR